MVAWVRHLHLAVLSDELRAERLREVGTSKRRWRGCKLA